MPHKTVKRNGITIPSVTTVINVLDKPGLVYWYGKHGTEECNRIKTAAATFGTHVHDLIQADIETSKGQVFIPSEEGYSKEELACFYNFREWYKTSGLNPISTEPEDAVISTRFNYQGTWDFIGRKDGRILVADWKTSNQLYDTVGLQLSAYAQLFGEDQGWSQEEIWKQIPDGMAVRIDKETAKVYTKEYKDLKFYFEVFESLLLPYQFASRTGAWHRERATKDE